MKNEKKHYCSKPVCFRNTDIFTFCTFIKGIIRNPDYSTARQKFEFDLELLFKRIKIINYYQIAKIFCVQILCFSLYSTFVFWVGCLNFSSLWHSLELDFTSQPSTKTIPPLQDYEKYNIDWLIFLVWHYVSYHVLVRMNDGWSVVKTIKAFNSWL